MESLDFWAIFNWWGLLVFVPLVVWPYKIGWPLQALWAYCLWNAVATFQNPWAHDYMFTFTDGQRISMMNNYLGTSASACVQMLVLPIGVMSIPRRYFIWWDRVFLAIAVVDLILVATLGYGFFKVSSLDMAFVVAVLPACPYLGAGVIGAALTGPRMGTAVMIFIGQALSYCLAMRRWIYVVPALLGIAALPFAGHFMSSAHPDAGRIEAWTRFMEWWGANVNHYFGSGIGTFLWIGPAIDHLKEPLFMQMHNDWLQILFEMGYVGWFLVWMAFTYLLMSCFKRPNLFAMLIGMAVFGVTYHPLRYFLSALLLLCIVREIVEVEDAPGF